MLCQVHATVEQTGKHTFFGRTATLLQSVDSLGSLQRVLMRVVTVLLVRPGIQGFGVKVLNRPQRPRP